MRVRLTAYGTLYKALDRLERAGYLESRWEDPDYAAEAARPRRRFYRITALGETAAAEARAARNAAAAAARPRRTEAPGGVAMTTSRLQGRRGDGSAVVRGWVAVYTLGLPGGDGAGGAGTEVAGDLADETLDAVRRGETADLRRRRRLRWSPVSLTTSSGASPTPPSSRAGRVARDPARSGCRCRGFAVVLLAISAIGTAGALALVVQGP